MVHIRQQNPDWLQSFKEPWSLIYSGDVEEFFPSNNCYGRHKDNTVPGIFKARFERLFEEIKLDCCPKLEPAAILRSMAILYLVFTGNYK